MLARCISQHCKMPREMRMVTDRMHSLVENEPGGSNAFRSHKTNDLI